MNTNPDQHVSTKVNTLRYSRGSGGFPPGAEEMFRKRKSNEMKAFQGEIFLTFFLQDSLNPQNYELAPRIPENNYQLPENK